jgi:hypothetical protein
LRQHIGINSMPSLSANPLAVVSLSPVTITSEAPRRRNWLGGNRKGDPRPSSGET